MTVVSVDGIIYAGTKNHKGGVFDGLKNES